MQVLSALTVSVCAATVVRLMQNEFEWGVIYKNICTERVTLPHTLVVVSVSILSPISEMQSISEIGDVVILDEFNVQVMNNTIADR